MVRRLHQGAWGLRWVDETTTRLAGWLADGLAGTTHHSQVDYWLPDPEIKPTKFRISVMRPDNQGVHKLLKKASVHTSL